MVDLSIQTSQRISALVDGQLSGDEFTQTLAELKSSPQARAQWDTYHLVGEAMRHGQVGLRVHDADFLARLRQRVAQDAIGSIAIKQENTWASVTIKHVPESANASSWRLVAGLASVAVAGVLTWQGLSLKAEAPAQLAGVTPTAAGQLLVRRDGTSALVMADEPQVMIRDPQLDAMLAAHRQWGGTSALQMPTGFLRNATFEEGGR